MEIISTIEQHLGHDHSKKHNSDSDIMSDIRYICKSCSLITEALQKGCDIMQMPNGDIIITEVKTLTFQYTWDEKKGKLVRLQSGGRTKKTKSSRAGNNEVEYNEEYEMEDSL